jgi:uncharacterized coiled-coil protein SlyX
MPPMNPNLTGMISQQEAARLKELDRRVSEQQQSLDKLSGKLHATEKLAYEVRRDMSKGLNELETHIGKRCEQLARAVQEVNKMAVLSNNTTQAQMSTPSIPPIYLTSGLDRQSQTFSQKPGSAPYPYHV